jgi:hypothetical protein
MPHVKGDRDLFQNPFSIIISFLNEFGFAARASMISDLVLKPYISHMTSLHVAKPGAGCAAHGRKSTEYS